MGIAFVLSILISFSLCVSIYSHETDIFCSKIENGSFGSLHNITFCQLSAENNAKILVNYKNTTVRVKNQHNETFEHINAIVADNQVFDYFPQGLHDAFINLNAISVINCRLIEINNLDLKVFPKLEFLNLRNNELKSLGEKLFKFNPKLTHILLNDNLILTVAIDTFVGTENLQILGFKNNLCFSGDAMNMHDLLMLEIKILMNCSNFSPLQNYSKVSNDSINICNCSVTLESSSVDQSHANIKFYQIMLNTTAVIILTIAVCYLLYKAKTSAQVRNVDTTLQTSQLIADSPRNAVTYIHDDCDDYTQISCKKDSNPAIINEDLYSDIGVDQDVKNECPSNNDVIYAEVNKSNK